MDTCCNNSKTPTCNYPINQLPLHNVFQRPFECPPQFNLFFFKEPPLFSFNRCKLHRVFEPVDDICNPNPQEDVLLRVGDCPRCFQILRYQTRPTYQKRMREVQARMRENAEKTRQALGIIQTENRQLEGKLMEVYNKYENDLRVAVRQFQQQEMQCFEQMRKKKK